MSSDKWSVVVHLPLSNGDTVPNYDIDNGHLSGVIVGGKEPGENIKVGDLVRIYKINRLGTRVNFEETDIIAPVEAVTIKTFKAYGITFLKRNMYERNPQSHYRRKAELTTQESLNGFKLRKDTQKKKKALVRELKEYNWSLMSLEELKTVKKLLK